MDLGDKAPALVLALHEGVLGRRSLNDIAKVRHESFSDFVRNKRKESFIVRWAVGNSLWSVKTATYPPRRAPQKGSPEGIFGVSTFLSAGLQNIPPAPSRLIILCSMTRLSPHKRSRFDSGWLGCLLIVFMAWMKAGRCDYWTVNAMLCACDTVLVC